MEERLFLIAEYLSAGIPRRSSSSLSKACAANLVVHSIYTALPFKDPYPVSVESVSSYVQMSDILSVFINMVRQQGLS